MLVAFDLKNELLNDFIENGEIFYAAVLYVLIGCSAGNSRRSIPVVASIASTG